jgi:hypothetical protein
MVLPPPWTSVVSAPFNRNSDKETLISVVDCLVCVVANADCVLGIEKDLEIAVVNIGEGYGVEVMDDDAAADFSVGDAEVTAEVSDNDVATELLPRVVCVEELVQISVVAECLFADFTAELEVAVSLLESGEGDEFGI